MINLYLLSDNNKRIMNQTVIFTRAMFIAKLNDIIISIVLISSYEVEILYVFDSYTYLCFLLIFNVSEIGI